MKRLSSLALLLGLLTTLLADGPMDNMVDKVRPVPPLPKEAASATEKAELLKGAKELGDQIEALKGSLKGKKELEYLPDVQVYHNAVRYAATYNEIFEATKEVPVAKKLLQIGFDRAKELKELKAPWAKQTGLVVRGYVSKIDGSVQPYGLVVPSGYQFDGAVAHRLDLWCHGRGETLSELNFINQRQSNAGEFTPANAIVLHLYGRYCCANKLAGEIDCFEAMEHVKKNYRIDVNRVVMRGFSMGGAAAWHFGVHYPSAWCAVAPGAGFSETPDFLKVFQKEVVQPTDYERKLFRMYDCNEYAVNLFNLPTVAYSGENDNQKQAADIMAKALKAEGIELTHIIGPKTGHGYHPEAKKEINARIDSIVEKGRDAFPRAVKFQTFTLRYNSSFWIRINSISEHWEAARIEAEALDGGKFKIMTKNIDAFSVLIPAGYAPFDVKTKPVFILDGAEFSSKVAPGSDRSYTTHWQRQQNGGKATWVEVNEPVVDGTKKAYGLQGPIDDAFMSRFVMVRPSGEAMNETVGKFVKREMEHATVHWRQQFRGEALSKMDSEITDADIAQSNLILWGDPKSNEVLAKIVDKLPIQWSALGVVLAGVTYEADKHVPVLIYPNPLNPKKYVVINSGFTFREYDYLNNARQIPKLPDFALVDATTPMTSRGPGKIVTAGFFNESWQLPAKK